MKIKTESKRGFTRRSFLEWTGIGVGGAALSTALPFSLEGLSKAEAAQFTNYASGTWVPSCCNMCGGQCGVAAYVEDGRVRKIEPQGGLEALTPNPNNIANVSDSYQAAVADGDLGRLCCKGNSAIKSLYDPDRIQTPLRRVGERGSGQFEPITWEEAIEEVAMNLALIRARYGARSLVWFAEDHSFNHPQVELCKAYGTPNFSNHSNLCDTARKAHYKSTLGNDRPLPDMESTDLLFVWGWNFLSALKWVHLAPIFTRARMSNPNFQFIYVDPVFNVTAGKADRWVPIRPGTDGALALALCKHLVDAGAVDTAFRDAYTLGYAEFVAYLGAGAGAVYDYSTVPWAGTGMLAWASSVTGIPQADITAVGDALVTAFNAGRRICIDVWSGPGHHTNATQGGRAINCLNLLLGAVDGRGEMVLPLRSGPGSRSWSWGDAYHFNWLDAAYTLDGWRADGRDDVNIPATYTYPDGTTQANAVSGAIKKKYSYSHGSGIYVEMIRRMVEQADFVGNPYPMKAAMIVFQNLMMSTPNTARNETALNNMEFICVVDSHLSETALMADIVIPGTNYLERNDFNANWSTFRSVGLRRWVVPSWFGGISEPQFFLELGAAMGFQGFKDAPENMTDDAYNADEWAKFNSSNNWGNQITWDQLKAAGTWIETIVAPTDGAASTPKGGTHFHKHKATKTFAAGYTETAITVGGQTVYVVKDSSSKVQGIGTGSLALNDTFEAGFGTSSARCQFWDPTFYDYFRGAKSIGTIGGNTVVTGDTRYHPLPYYAAPEDAPATPGSGNYPWYFISWKEVVHTHTRTFNNPWLMELMRENRLLIHPDVANAEGIAEGDWVWVQTPIGLVKVRAHITYGIQPETVGFFRGFGHWALGSLAMGKGAHDGWVLPGKAELHSGQAVHKEVACRIYKEV
ncbi:MAG: molybdopterin-dependent oxidoreductase [Deltaproteobacteria bacterium]|nr:molybdopterin-dependent oxidoreductase [Deltaproteobacteria bacterium]